ncbi:Ig-like domain-containing protein [Streptococcus suis]|uniref:Ig-like domain-containing protein n=1 Tax=Streptococcus suis TaxID=1307 RepID=UPI000CF5947C|nr:Ig-like domain-containing protein [Streptococcus suis]
MLDFFCLTFGVQFTGLFGIEFSSDSFFNYTLVETAEKPITLYARKEWNEFDSDDVIDIELQVQNEDAVWMTSGEFIKSAFELKVKPDTQPGDSFTIKLDSKLSPTGIRERTLPPIPLKVGDTVVATGRYDEATNSFIYTFNDYVRREQNIKLSASYATRGADLKNVPYSGI